MSKNQALAHQHEELYKAIKAIDINALRAFILCTTADIVAQISYWDTRKQKPGLDADQISVINLEIIRLEAIMIARTRITMDLFEVVELTNKDSDVLSKDLHNSLKVEGAESSAKEEVNLPANEEKPDAKVITMIPDVKVQPIKLSAIQEQVKALLAEGKQEEAVALATKYLAPGLYLPNKDKQKPEPWHEGRIKSWVDEVMKHIKKPVEITKNSEKAATASTNPATDVLPETQNGQATGIKDDAGNVQSQKTGIEDAIVVGPIEVLTAEWDKLVKWIEESGKQLSDFFAADDELLTEQGRKDYSCFDLEVENPTEVIKMLKSKYDINAVIPAPESNEDIWENQTNSLQEEIDLIEAFLDKAHELRGSVDGPAKNEGNIKDLCEDFFLSRNKEDYPEMDKVASTIINRPKLLLEAKELFSFTQNPKGLVLYTEGGTGVKNSSNTSEIIDCYDKIRTEIKADLDGMKPDDETRNALNLKWINKLRGKILAGKKPGDKNPNPTNRMTFYTSLHVIHFIEQVETEFLFGNDAINKGENHIEPKNADASTTPEAGASEKQTEQVSSKDAQTAKPKLHECKTLEEALLLVIKNGGVAEDAMVHPFCEKLKGTKVKDPGATTEIELNDENYKKYISEEFEKVKETWKSQLTSYPVEEMVKLISLASETGVTPEEFVKENVGLIKKSNGEFLSLTGKIGEVEQTVLIKSEKDFLVYVAEVYALQKKLEENESAEVSTKYEVTKFRDLIDFEAAARAKVITDKLAFGDLQKWAREELVDKVFMKDPSGEPIFTHDKAANLDTWLEIMTRKLYETPESLAAKNKILEDEAIKRLPTSKTGLLGFVSEMKAFCIEKKIDSDLKTLRAKMLELSKVHNKEMHDKYMKNYEGLKEEGLIPDRKEEPKIESKEQKKAVIVDAPDSKELTDKVVLQILQSAKEITTKDKLAEMLSKHKSNPIAMMRAAIQLICKNKQIKDMQMEEAEVNTWVASLMPAKTEDKVASPTLPATESPEVKPGAGEETVADVTSIAKVEEPAPAKTEVETVSEYEALKVATDKKNFREALDAIARKFEDSSEHRSKLIAIIKEGKGAHTRKVGRGPIQDMNIAIKNAYERVTNADKHKDVE